jgi:UDP-N-acetylglucosamine--dolichyl-phosphate N-acetylglucosaminephosphotransferase
VAASVYILSLILFIPFAFSMPILEQANVKTAAEGITVAEFPHYQVCIIFMLFSTDAAI